MDLGIRGGRCGHRFARPPPAAHARRTTAPLGVRPKRTSLRGFGWTTPDCAVRRKNGISIARSCVGQPHIWERSEVTTCRSDLITDDRAEFGVQRPCRVPGASRSGYYRQLATEQVRTRRVRTGLERLLRSEPSIPNTAAPMAPRGCMPNCALGAADQPLLGDPADVVPRRRRPVRAPHHDRGLGGSARPRSSDAGLHRHGREHEVVWRRHVHGRWFSWLYLATVIDICSHRDLIEVAAMSRPQRDHRRAGDGVAADQLWATSATLRTRWRSLLLAWRSITEPDEISHYIRYGPANTEPAELVRAAGSCSAIEESFQTPLRLASTNIRSACTRLVTATSPCRWPRPPS